MKLSPELRAEMTEALTAHLIIADREWLDRLYGKAFFPSEMYENSVSLDHLRTLAEAAMTFIYGEADAQS